MRRGNPPGTIPRKGLIRASDLPSGALKGGMGSLLSWNIKKKTSTVVNRVPTWVIPEVAVNILGYALFETGQIKEPIGMLLKQNVGEGHKTHFERNLEKFQLQYQDLLHALKIYFKDYDKDTVELTFTLGRPVSPQAWINIKLPVIPSPKETITEDSTSDLPLRYTRMLVRSIVQSQWTPKTAMAGVLPGRILVTPTEASYKDKMATMFKRKKYFGTGVEISIALEGEIYAQNDFSSNSTTNESDYYINNNNNTNSTFDNSGNYDEQEREETQPNSKATEKEMICVGTLKGFL